MGNCQAIDAASLVIEHQNGKVDKMYLPISASQVMKMNPGHYVALLITTTVCHTKTETTDSSNATDKKGNSITGRNSVRITRVKLLRPVDTLALGHVYRLISTQEAMKGLVAKKQAKLRKNGIELANSEGLQEAEKLVKKFQQDKKQQVSRQGHRSRTTSNAKGGGTRSRPKTWQPSLNSISEFTS
ncbi:hypothetical protein RND81_13G126600 [Saponaria officinalis]|uniref:Uncharacterized protein n=1 Tax=Saponaria officinalis TaxID=3572 RepID=A0AAW1H021_SAPOF